MTDEQMTIAEFIAKHQLTVSATPVPFRLRAEIETGERDAWDREAFHWLVQVSKADGSPIWRGFYSAGSGLAEHWARSGAPLYRTDSRGNPKHDSIAARMVSGKQFSGPFRSVTPVGPGKRRTLDQERAWLDLAARFSAAGPDPADVLASLRSDASGTDESFFDWADSLGYERDSRNAESIYLECQKTALELRKGLGWSGYRELMECEPE